MNLVDSASEYSSMPDSRSRRPHLGIGSEKSTINEEAARLNVTAAGLPN